MYELHNIGIVDIGKTKKNMKHNWWCFVWLYLYKVCLGRNTRWVLKTVHGPLIINKHYLAGSKPTLIRLVLSLQLDCLIHTKHSTYRSSKAATFKSLIVALRAPSGVVCVLRTQNFFLQSNDFFRIKLTRFQQHFCAIAAYGSTFDERGRQPGLSLHALHITCSLPRTPGGVPP